MKTPEEWADEVANTNLSRKYLAQALAEDRAEMQRQLQAARAERDALQHESAQRLIQIENQAAMILEEREELKAAQAERAWAVSHLGKAWAALTGGDEGQTIAPEDVLREAQRVVAELHDRQNEIEQQIGYTITAEQERDAALEREKKLREAILKALPFLLTSRWEDHHLEDLRLALLSPDAEGKP